VLDRWARIAQQARGFETAQPYTPQGDSVLGRGVGRNPSNAGATGMRAARCGSRPVGPNPVADQPEQAPPLALRPREAAKRLRISERLLWQLTHDGHIPCVRVGTGKRKSVLYPVALLEEWLREQAGQPAQPTDAAKGVTNDPR